MLPLLLLLYVCVCVCVFCFCCFGQATNKKRKKKKLLIATQHARGQKWQLQQQNIACARCHKIVLSPKHRSLRLRLKSALLNHHKTNLCISCCSSSEFCQLLQSTRKPVLRVESQLNAEFIFNFFC